MKAWKYIGIILATLIIAGGLVLGGYFFSQSKENKAKNNTSNNSNSGGNTPTSAPEPVTIPTCGANILSLATASNGGAGAGTLSVNIVLTNISNSQCSLYGYPGVSLLDNNGTQIGSPADRTTNITPQIVTLNPGLSATAAVFYPEAGNFSPGVCANGAKTLRVYPPNDYGYLTTSTTITSWCPGFQTAPVQAQ